jgi:predicted membrane protein
MAITVTQVGWVLFFLSILLFSRRTPSRRLVFFAVIALQSAAIAILAFELLSPVFAIVLIFAAALLLLAPQTSESVSNRAGGKSE